jgi:hypothetical protein
MLAKAIFKWIQAQWAIEADMMADEDGRNALLPVFYHKGNSALLQSLVGKTTYWNPTWTLIEQVLRHILAEQSKSPTDTGAVIVVPRLESERWWKLVRHFKIAAVIPSGSKGVFYDKGVATGVEASQFDDAGLWADDAVIGGKPGGRTAWDTYVLITKGLTLPTTPCPMSTRR